MAQVVFEDFSVQVMEAMEESVLKALESAAGEMVSQTKIRTNMNSAPYNVKGSWKYNIDESKKIARVGSPLEASYWEELGTGEYALNKDGRKGWWVYVDGPSNGPTQQPIRTQEEAEAIAESMRADGLQAHATNGRQPNRPLHRAFTEEKESIKRIIEDEIRKGMT